MLVREERPQEVARDLAERLRQIAGPFDIERLLAEEVRIESVESYYRQSLLAYLMIHNRQGALHYALDDGGFAAQADIVRSVIEDIEAEDVLELASGTGFNASLLAATALTTRFCGVDLMPNHVRIARARARSRGLENLKFLRGDMHCLPLSSGSFDLAYAIEGFCHAVDLEAAISEAGRMLRPGGRFVVIDGFLSRPPASLTPDEQTAVSLFDKALAVSRTWTVGDFISAAERHHLRLIRLEDLSHRVVSDTARIARISRRFFRHRRLARAVHRALPRRLVANSVAGILGPLMTEIGYSYNAVVLERCRQATQVMSVGRGLSCS